MTVKNACSEGYSGGSGSTGLAPTMALYGVFEGLDIGLDRRGPVLWSLYERHRAFSYSGHIDEVTIEPGRRAPAGVA